MKVAPRVLAFVTWSAGICVPILTAVRSADAHNPFEISATAGYRWGGRAPVVRDPDVDQGPVGRLILEGSPAFGVMAGYRMQRNGFLYLSYSRQTTTVRFEPEDPTNAEDPADPDLGATVRGKMGIEYYQLGGTLETTRGIFVPYLGASVGFARFISYGGGADRLFFAPVLDGGLKIDLHEHVHLRILGRLPIVFSSGDVYCRDTVGCLELDKFSPIVQGEVQAGVGVSF